MTKKKSRTDKKYKVEEFSLHKCDDFNKTNKKDTFAKKLKPVTNETSHF